MARYLEYEKNTGRIICEIISASEPAVSDNYALLEIPEDAELDTTIYAVKNGVLVKNYETNEERIERERIKREKNERVRKRIKSMMYEVCITLLEDDSNALEELRKEYRELKAYL